MSKFDLTGVSFVKRASSSPLTLATNGQEDEDKKTQEIVSNMLADIRKRGEEACLEYAEKLDKFTGSAVVTNEEIEEQTKDLSDQVKQDIEFMVHQVRI